VSIILYYTEKWQQEEKRIRPQMILISNCKSLNWRYNNCLEIGNGTVGCVEGLNGMW
jgi:hypothetical protein